MAEDGNVRASAQQRTAAESQGSRWDRARVNLVVPIGVIVAVAIVCVVVAVLTSAQRADEVSFRHEQSLIREAIVDHGEQVLQQLASVAETAHATVAIRTGDDPSWVQRHVGNWLQTYFAHDIVAVLDGADHIKYTRLRAIGGEAAIDMQRDLAAILDLLRGRLKTLPDRALDVLGGQNPKDSGRRIALLQRFLDHPAIVAAVAVGSEADLAGGNQGAPIIVSIKYIDEAMLRDIGGDLQISDLHEIGSATNPRGDAEVELTDGRGAAIARFAWKATAPASTWSCPLA